MAPYDLAPTELAAFMRDNSATVMRTFKKLDMEHKRDDDMLRFVRRQLMAHGIRCGAHSCPVFAPTPHTQLAERTSL